VAASPLIAVDTEFVREKTYYPQLCLIQVATRDYAACIDCLAPLDLQPLYAELFRPERIWVLHSARQDLEVIWQRAEQMPPQLIDTQIASALLGWPPQLGLEGLLKRTLDVELGESYARTLAEWQRRFQESWLAIQALGFDQRFKRMWEYYLAYCEAGFRLGTLDVGQYKLVAR
jgi:ribonuclease D